MFVNYISVETMIHILGHGEHGVGWIGKVWRYSDAYTNETLEAIRAWVTIRTIEVCSNTSPR
jgi:hypothetical protein